MTNKQTEELVELYEKQYKYYKGWVFAYEHPGFFIYYQMGGPISVAFTPEHDEENTVSLQVQNEEGQVLSSETVPFDPVRHDILRTKIDPSILFRMVRPLLEAYNTW